VFEELRKIRKEKNIKAIDMAILIGLKTEGAYYKKETGQVPFTLEEGKEIAKLLKMPIEKIFKKELSCEDN
jgi:DNA-binding XRE family transcriptional regulator